MSIAVRNFELDSGQLLHIRRGDIPQENVDAILNAANAHLQHGGGSAGAISERGGPIIQAKSDRWLKN